MVSPSAMQIDPSNLLYLRPSDTPGTLLVSHKLTGVEDYNIWSRSMRIALLAKKNQELSAGIVFASSTALVWSDLNEHFDKVDASRIYFLYREIVTHVQGTHLFRFITGYFDYCRMNMMLLLPLLFATVNL
ncbi:hypothetical protein PVK06_027823 [Gossypium arboreum]|uniref:Retrotransposon Copia-like N-terminal domain-containing protein n=1 Tax=Gossypium arboreum TaxID=29729 RepID=A0ABR0P3Y8_GOSAR|nr:hypothetical protein PVK06_027823 [Gossypium arboreum]